MHTTDRQRLRELIVRLPRWGGRDTRGALYADLTWDLTTRDPEPMPPTPADAAEHLIELALTAPGGPGMRGLLEDLRELGADGAAGSRALAELAAGLTDAAPPRPWAGEPYPGLRPLECRQAPLFFGRRAATRDLLRRLSAPAGARLILVAGVLGCGKSSLVQAGVAGRLAAGELPRLPAAAHWQVSSMVPAGHGGDPFLALTYGLAREPGVAPFDPPTEAAAIKGYGAPALAGLLARVLAGRPADACWLLVIDQFEELFTAVDEDLAGEFLETLIEALEEPRLRLLGTLRVDLLHRCCALPDLARVLNAGGLYCLAPPSRPSLERMILGPLTELELAAPMQIEPALVEHLLRDASGQAGGLALLADALKDTYDQARQRGGAAAVMTLDLYAGHRHGGLKAVIARRAERALDRSGPAARTTLNRLFSQLITVAPDGTATRRRLEWVKLAAQPETAALAQALAAPDTRLVKIGQGERATVEIVHEALLQEWLALRHWIERRREALHAREQLEVEARTWAAIGYPPNLRWRHEVLESARILLAETGLLDELERDLDISSLLTPEPEWLLCEILCSRVEPVQREEIGLRLAQIGDPRPGVGVADGLPAIRWCTIPAGEVLIEGHGPFAVAPLRIAAYPVTQCQFVAFLEAADGFASPKWWTDLRQTPPVSGPARRHGNYPATQVNWFEATAFCRWLSARLGYSVRLPDEWEWQWAAQGARPGFIYPWGRDWREGHANTDEGAVGRATAVGMYPAGRSAQGVYDLAGNTWEWCRNRYDKPKIIAADPDRSRVLRGGSWRVNMGFSRADFRLDGLPEDRMGGSSFRVVTGD